MLPDLPLTDYTGKGRVQSVTLLATESTDHWFIPFLGDNQRKKTKITVNAKVNSA